MFRPKPSDMNPAYEAADLAGEINKIYQRMNLAGKNASVDRLRRKVNKLAELVEKIFPESESSLNRRSLEEAVQIIHECVPLMDLNRKSLLLSDELQNRWTHRLQAMEAVLDDLNRTGRN